MSRLREQNESMKVGQSNTPLTQKQNAKDNMIRELSVSFYIALTHTHTHTYAQAVIGENLWLDICGGMERDGLLRDGDLMSQLPVLFHRLKGKVDHARWNAVLEINRGFHRTMAAIDSGRGGGNGLPQAPPPPPRASPPQVPQAPPEVGRQAVILPEGMKTEFFQALKVSRSCALCLRVCGHTVSHMRRI